MSFKLAIEPGALILITGATGSVGGAVTNEILKAGYRVRAIVRDEVKAGFLRDVFHACHGRDAFETWLMADMLAHDELVSAMQGCSGVVHTASNTSLSPDPTVVIPSSVALALAMLRAAAVVPSITRFVFTSSTSTLPPFLSRVSAPSRDNLPPITAGSWASDEIVEKAWGAGPPYNPQNAGAVYAASKILSERACWDFMAKHDPAPGFTLNTVVPATQIGAFVHEDLKSSVNGLLWKVWQGSADEGGVKARSILHWVLGSVGVGGEGSCLLNLGDSGILHLAALVCEDLVGERVLGVGECFDGDDVLDVMRHLAGDEEKDLPGSVGMGKSAKTEVETNVDRSRMLELLGRFGRDGAIGLQESVRQMVESGM